MTRLIATTSTISFSDRWDHFIARWGYRRSWHRVEPGIYRLGNPGLSSQAFVTSNYKMSFDLLRASLKGVDCYILVLDTEGVNVWCAAGKGSFGTDELVRKVKSTGLRELVSHRTLIVPQLGAAGVSAHEVERRTGFAVEYGPVRASDLPEYLKTHRATPEMRKVEFKLKDRLVVVPVEVVGASKYVLPLALLALLLRHPGIATTLAAVLIAGTILFPILLPFIPTHDFTTKGMILGVCVAFTLELRYYVTEKMPLTAASAVDFAVLALMVSPWVAFLALDFTGSTPIASRSGVRREIFTYIPLLAIMFVVGIALGAVMALLI